MIYFIFMLISFSNRAEKRLLITQMHLKLKRAIVGTILFVLCSRM